MFQKSIKNSVNNNEDIINNNNNDNNNNNNNFFLMKRFSHTDQLYLNLIKTTRNFSEIMHKKETSILIQISGKPFIIQNSKKSHRVIKNQVKSPSGWHKRQCADFNNTDNFLIHEA